MNVARKIVEALLEGGIDRRSFLKIGGVAVDLVESVAVLQKLARKLYLDDSDFVVDGCAEVSEVLKAACDRLGIPCELKFGYVTDDTGADIEHSWLVVDGELFDPVAFAVGWKGTNYREDARVADVLGGFQDSAFEWRVDQLLSESIAVDLDGTLAKDSGWKGPEHIGEPVKPMLDLVRKLLDDGEEVVIFTARAHDGKKSTKDYIRDWLKDNGLPDLEITNEKRPDMEKFYDDKAIEVAKNKGVSEAKISKRDSARYDQMAKTDPHGAEVERLGGKLIRPPLPSREKWNAMLAAYAPGCGSPTTLPGTNGGTFPCGSRVDGIQSFCPHCQPGI